LPLLKYAKRLYQQAVKRGRLLPPNNAGRNGEAKQYSEADMNGARFDSRQPFGKPIYECGTDPLQRDEECDSPMEPDGLAVIVQSARRGLVHIVLFSACAGLSMQIKIQRSLRK
jgi:hypothetical protein